MALTAGVLLLRLAFAISADRGTEHRCCEGAWENHETFQNSLGKAFKYRGGFGGIRSAASV